MSHISSPPTDGTTFFEQWLAARSAPGAGRERLSPNAAKPYRYIWRAWLRWIATDHAGAKACPWQEANAQHVASFLASGISPSSPRRSGPISEITRRRYWRLISTLYEHALFCGLVQQNPVHTLSERPPRPEQSEGQVLSSAQWAAIDAHLPAIDGSRWDVRDRAILLLLMECALTTGEICTLQIDQVRLGHRPMAIEIDGPRPKQQRTLAVSERTRQALLAWIDRRASLPPPAAASRARLFVSQRGVPMIPRGVFHLVSSTITAALKAHNLDAPNHIGAQVLRNTRLVMWLNAGVPPDEVVRRAGYKNTRGFTGLLQHITTNDRAGQQALTSSNE